MLHKRRSLAPFVAVLGAALALAWTGAARAADPQPYAVTIRPTPDATLNKDLHDAATLISLEKKAPVGPFALVARARDDAGRLVTVLNSFGYYKGRVDITIDGLPLDDPGLPDRLRAVPAKTSVPVVVQPVLGPLFHVGTVKIEGTLPPSAAAEVKLKPGDPATAKSILAVQGRVLADLQEHGHAFASVSDPIAVEHPKQEVIDVTYKVDAGPRVDIGPIGFEGLKTVNASYVRERLDLRPGQLYDAQQIEKARQDLASMGVFSTVDVRAGKRLNQEGLVPITFVFVEAPAHTVSFGGSYATDLGFAANVSWTDHNLFGNGETLTFSAAATEIGGTAAKQPGYDVGATYLIPDWLARDQTLSFNVAALKEYLYSYQRTAYVASALVTHNFGKYLSLSFGPSFEQEKVIQEGITGYYTLLGLPVTLKFDNTNNLFEPTRGFRVTASVTPYGSFGGAGSPSFALAQAVGSTYLDLTGNGRSILALRAQAGEAFGATQFGLPPDLRFYAGGSSTVRGYQYQWVGPHFPDGYPIGGTAYDAGTVEFRQRILKSYGVVGFVDAGQVSGNGGPFQGRLDVGAGMGVRYFTSFGPIRLDFAVPLVYEPKQPSFEFYIGLGEAF